jgi:hypothetical protein
MDLNIFLKSARHYIYDNVITAYVRNCPHHLTFPEAPHSYPKANLSRQHYSITFFLGHFHQVKGRVV